MTPADRWMALDVGHKRIGVALSDPLKLLARPLHCLQRKNLTSDVKSILELLENHQVTRLIIGLPRHLDGREAEVVSQIEPLVEAIKQASEVALEWCDERLSSKDAEELMAELQIPVKNRRGLRDAYAAAVILRRYLEEGPTRR